eukprot:702250-Pyramimonas_sp.AAC.1
MVAPIACAFKAPFASCRKTRVHKRSRTRADKHFVRTPTCMRVCTFISLLALPPDAHGYIHSLLLAGALVDPRLFWKRARHLSWTASRLLDQEGPQRRVDGNSA